MTLEQENELLEAFKLFDTDNSGSISAQELKEAMVGYGVHPDEEELAQMIAKIDKNGDGQISFAKFKEIMTSKLNESETQAELIRAFQLFDTDHSGRITMEKLKKVAIELGADVSDKELDDMLNEADRESAYIPV